MGTSRGAGLPAREGAVAALSGVLFAVGLALSGMTRPAKVSGFLDLAGAWDPSLAFVMGGAVAVYFLAWRFALRRAAVVPGAARPPAPRARIDARLVGGAALFGLGWGASGFCPGPALASLASGARAALWFVPAMALGMLLVRLLEGRTARAADPGSTASDVCG